MKEIKYRTCSLGLVVLIIFNLIISSVSSVFADAETITVSGGEKGLSEANIAENVYKGFLDCYKTASTQPIGFRGTREDSGARSATTLGDPNNPDALQTNRYYVDSDGDVFEVLQGSSKKYVYYVDYKSTTDVGRIMESNNVFSDQTLTKVDRRLEDVIGESKKDGKIWCNENNKSTGANITSEFKRIFGVDSSSLICDGEKFALFKPKDEKANAGKKCPDVIKDNNIELVKNTADGQKYIDRLYQNWKKTNAYAKNINDIKDPLKTGGKDGSRDYAYELKIFKSDCTNQKKSLDSVTGETFNFTIKELDESGHVTEKYPQMKNNRWDKSGRNYFTNYYPNGSYTPLSCEELAKKINGDFDDYRKTIANAKADACNTEEVFERANSIVKGYRAKIDAKIPLKDEEKKEYKTLSDALLKKDFTVDDGHGGKKCLETNKLKVVVDDNAAGTDSSTNTDIAGDAKQSYCQENGGFLSWMLCPAIADGASTTSGLLGYITKLTTVHTSIIEQFSNQDSSIYKAWSAFRNIANIGFVIMLLVVVFSQVTNIGISNYNIKKILPKLIITAILVNFSYLIMGVLIDLSQIAGNGVGSLIRSVAAGSMNADASTMASATISAIASMVIRAAGVVGTGAVLVSGPALILPVVMFIATALISVFFGFIMLTIRQAAIIMVVVLAPLMMVLYALPNTSAITKKYLSIVKSLLMLYPMFIFATSAGALASSIIIGTSTDLLMMIVGGLLNVLPYFAIPSMTSKSLAGLGAITGAFDKMRGGALKGASMAGGVFAASEFYKNAKNNYAADRSVARAKRDLSKFNEIKANGGKLSIAQMRRQANAAGIVNNDSKLRAGSNSAGRGALSNMSGLGFENLKATAEKEFRDGEVKNIMNKLASDGVDEGTMESKLISALETGAKYEDMTEDKRHANDIKIEALTRALGATKTGRKKISKIGQTTGLNTSNRAFTQLASAAVTLPGFADKQQIANRQFNEYLQNASYDKNDNAKSSSLISATRSVGLNKAYDDMTMDNFLKVGNEDAVEILGAKGANSLDSVVSQTASAALKDPNLISNFDKTKMSLVSAEMDNQRMTTINLRSGGTAQVFNPPFDFGEYRQTKNSAGEIVYTNNRGDIFNASTGKQIRNM